MGRSGGDEKILSYEDVVLRRSDMDILSGPHFLNDRIIEFYFSYLTSKYAFQDATLLPPSISFLIANCTDISVLKECLDPLKLSDKNLIIFTVNDNEDVNQAEGGSHWSLLVYYRKTNMFVHHDSLSGLNTWHARVLYEAVHVLLAGDMSASPASFMECPTPRQKNGYDCGLYVLAIAKVICDWHEDESEEKGGNWFSAVEKQVDSSGVAESRNTIKGLILDLKNGDGGSGR